MKILEYESSVIEYDDLLTREIIKDFVSGPQECTCCFCRNFLLAREQVYTEDFKKLLSQLGINYTKEIEVFQYYRISPGKQLYGGWHNFVGKIQMQDEKEVHNLVPDIKNFAWSFNEKHILIPKEFGNNPVVQIQWTGIVPWLLDEIEPK